MYCTVHVVHVQGHRGLKAGVSGRGGGGGRGSVHRSKWSLLCKGGN